MRLAGISLAGEFSGPGEPGDPTGIMFLRQVCKKHVDRYKTMKRLGYNSCRCSPIVSKSYYFQAEYLIRIGRYEPAMMYLNTTLEMEKENKNQTITLV